MNHAPLKYSIILLAISFTFSPLVAMEKAVESHKEKRKSKRKEKTVPLAHFLAGAETKIEPKAEDKKVEREIEQEVEEALTVLGESQMYDEQEENAQISEELSSADKSIDAVLSQLDLTKQENIGWFSSLTRLFKKSSEDAITYMQKHSKEDGSLEPAKVQVAIEKIDSSLKDEIEFIPQEHQEILEKYQSNFSEAKKHIPHTLSFDSMSRTDRLLEQSAKRFNNKKSVTPSPLQLYRLASVIKTTSAAERLYVQTKVKDLFTETIALVEAADANNEQRRKMITNINSMNSVEKQQENLPQLTSLVELLKTLKVEAEKVKFVEE